jgi:capsular polysaccharide biosynthesis protein
VRLTSCAGREPPPFPSKSRQAFFAAGAYEAEPLKLYSLKDVRFFGSSGLFAVGDAIVRDSALHWSPSATDDPRALIAELQDRLGRPPTFGPARRMTGAHLLAASRAANNHWHWHVDILPGLDLIARLGPIPGLRLLTDTKGGFPPDSLPPPRRALAPLWKAEEVVVDQLVFASTFANAGSRLHPHLAGVFAAIKSRLLPSPSGPRRRLFASRGPAGRRRLANRAEVERAFAAAGFDVVAPGELSYRDQMALFDSADVVVGEHGANLADLGFCRPGTRVVELFHPFANDLCYVSLAEIMGLSHRSVIGTAEAGDSWRLDPAQAIAAANLASD